VVDSDLIAKTVEYVKEKMSLDSTGHDWWHVYRVWENAKMLMKGEQVNTIVIELAALLHDIGDYKINNNDLNLSDQLVKKWLNEQNIEKQIIKKVCDIINTISFKGARTKGKLISLESKIVQDADRLDALGAIGIARAFAFGGAFKQKMYDPSMEPIYHNSFLEYMNRETTTINHFYEKLLLLKDLMNTKQAKSIAIERHRYMQLFLETFFEETKSKR